MAARPLFLKAIVTQQRWRGKFGCRFSGVGVIRTEERNSSATVQYRDKWEVVDLH